MLFLLCCLVKGKFVVEQRVKLWEDALANGVREGAFPLARLHIKICCFESPSQ